MNWACQPTCFVLVLNLQLCLFNVGTLSVPTQSHRLTLSCLSLSLQVQVWDTAGQERFRKSMVEHYYRNVHAVVFVYDVTNMASFRNLQTWIEVRNNTAKQLNTMEEHYLMFSFGAISVASFPQDYLLSTDTDVFNHNAGFATLYKL